MQRILQSPVQIPLPLDVRERAKLDEQRRPAVVAVLSELLLAAAQHSIGKEHEVRDEAK
jgi:hypothetical protein